MASLRIASGLTTAGKTAWQQYPGGKGIYVDVDTSKGGFKARPVYTTSLGGKHSHWSTTGATSIYKPSATGFRIFVRWSDGKALSPATANKLRWHIKWIGVES